MSENQPIVFVEGAYYKITFTRSFSAAKHVVVILGKHNEHSMIYKIISDDVDGNIPNALKEKAMYQNEKLPCKYLVCSQTSEDCSLYKTSITEKLTASSRGEPLKTGYGIDVQVFKEISFTGFDSFDSYEIEAISLDDMDNKYKEIIKVIEDCAQPQKVNVSMFNFQNEFTKASTNVKPNTKSQLKSDFMDRQRKAYLLHILRITSPRVPTLNSQTNQNKNYHEILLNLCKSGYLTEVELNYLQTQGVIKGDIGLSCLKPKAATAAGGKAPKKTINTKGATGKKMTILGRERNIYKVGRKLFVTYKKELIPISKARELEKLNKKKQSS